MICCGFYLTGGSDTTKEMWKSLFEGTRVMPHYINKSELEHFSVKLPENNRISSAKNPPTYLTSCYTNTLCSQPTDSVLDVDSKESCGDWKLSLRGLHIY